MAPCHKRIEAKIAEVEELQAIVRIRLANHLRSPSRDTRRGLEEALLQVDEAIDKSVCTHQLDRGLYA